ncbi:uncharacterized protein LOC118803960 isoform X3 [Colossoma macropomum]|uniref:uncharacterized protein LOC118803960 isoform X3 n=1 Tax=Colossoma macropomum TaxID=42526 RepID=UPI0018649D67|nr:uncharacterized protein LOC118803960 isoform X3 [Colossoma macropomum]
MQYYSSALCVLILLVTLADVSESAPSTVKVKLNEPATLPCSKRCSGLVRWTEFSKPTDVLAECDQTSCRSVKEGYQMIRDQYLKGDLSLIITDADSTKRGWYTCDCGGKDLCDVHLHVKVSESAVSTVKVKLNETAALPCSKRCSGVVRWKGSVNSTEFKDSSARAKRDASKTRVVRSTEFSKSTDVLAECDQTECRSVKKGCQMIHDQYLKGDLSLNITDADLSKSGVYTCECGASEICDVQLQVEEPEKRTDKKGDNEGPSSGGGQGGVSALVVVLVLVAVVVAGVGSWYWFRKRSQKSGLGKDEEKPMRSENASPDPNS